MLSLSPPSRSVLWPSVLLPGVPASPGLYSPPSPAPSLSYPCLPHYLPPLPSPLASSSGVVQLPAGPWGSAGCGVGHLTRICWLPVQGRQLRPSMSSERRPGSANTSKGGEGLRRQWGPCELTRPPSTLLRLAVVLPGMAKPATSLGAEQSLPANPLAGLGSAGWVVPTAGGTVGGPWPPGNRSSHHN